MVYLAVTTDGGMLIWSREEMNVSPWGYKEAHLSMGVSVQLHQYTLTCVKRVFVGGEGQFSGNA